MPTPKSFCHRTALFSVLVLSTLQNFEAQGLSRGRITGRILPAKGETTLPEGLEIILSTPRGLSEFQAVHSSGRFEFNNLTPGGYIITLKAPDRETVTRTVDLASGVDSGLSLYLTLNVGATTDQEAFPDPDDQVKSARWMQLQERTRKELLKAEQASAQDKPERALKHYRKALESEPGLFHVYNNMAAEYLKLGRTAEAIHSLRQSIELNPELSVSYRSLGLIYLDQENGLGEAMPLLQKACDMAPEDEDNWVGLGDGLYRSGQIKTALQAFQKALQLRGDQPTPELLIHMGNCYLQLNQLEEALHYYARFLEVEPKGQTAANVRALMERIERAPGRP